MRTLFKYLIITALLGIYSTSYAADINGGSTKTINQVSDFLEAFDDLAGEFKLTQNQKNQMIWALYEHAPKLFVSANKMFINRTELLEEQVQQTALPMNWIELHAEKQGELLKQLIIEKELLKEEVNSILDPQQRLLLSELFERLLFKRLNLFDN